MKKFELFMCCLGNGITVCNKAVVENGDYKVIAHIAECGKITWYVPISYVPGSDLMKIEHCANVQNKKWENWLASMSMNKQYEKLLNVMPTSVVLYVCRLDADINGKIAYLKKVCYEKSYF